MVERTLVIEGVTVPRLLYGTAWKEDATQRLTELASSRDFAESMLRTSGATTMKPPSVGPFQRRSEAACWRRKTCFCRRSSRSRRGRIIDCAS